MAFEILEDTALALMQFYQRTGRRCPTGAEARQLLVGKRSLSALMHQHPMFFRCEETSGFSLSSFSNDGPHDMVFLNNGCRVITVRTRIGPLLPAKPDPTVWERDPAMDRELHKCYFAPLNILTVCHGEVCTQSDVEEWLARHSVPAN